MICFVSRKHRPKFSSHDKQRGGAKKNIGLHFSFHEREKEEWYEEPNTNGYPIKIRNIFYRFPKKPS
jgi:hypothetical protein